MTNHNEENITNNKINSTNIIISPNNNINNSLTRTNLESFNKSFNKYEYNIETQSDHINISIHDSNVIRHSLSDTNLYIKSNEKYNEKNNDYNDIHTVYHLLKKYKIETNPIYQNISSRIGITVSEKYSEYGESAISDTSVTRDEIRLNIAELKEPIRFIPLSGKLKLKKLFKNKIIELTVDKEYILINYKEKNIISIPSSSLYAAEIINDTLMFKLHFFEKDKKDRLKRKHKYYTFLCNSIEEINQWSDHINNLVKWLANIPKNVKRKIMCIVNPVSGNKKSEAHYSHVVQPYMKIANIQIDKFTTKYNGHCSTLIFRMNA